MAGSLHTEPRTLVRRETPRTCDVLCLRGRAPWPLFGRAIVAAKVVPLQRLIRFPGCGCRRSEDQALTGDARG
ncbi:hypothetical protein NDU88_006873 [Pleurodeles waltl]|uniref:Uncharacterized protein n=1 Tax=Pleurodeles waltl TaxID=8319 RepID=A0AAV7UQC6_PLEWA|nr:hypothetical protein NDU88_006873 [Pleurodeles waltl]